MTQEFIRNFAIIAHVDHGKSTLSDRLLEITGTIAKEKMREQFLDQNPISRERGITIKLAPVRMNYTLNANSYTLNLIDTPGHVDFSYEVSRTLAACEGVVLLVDATQGVQAQTVAHLHVARKLNLKIIPVLNKIDLENAVREKVAKELSDTFGFSKDEILYVSAKTGENVENLLKTIIHKIPPPRESKQEVLRALVFDALYDEHKGVVAFVRIVDGAVKKGDSIRMFRTGATTNVVEVGFFYPALTPSQSISTGEIGYIVTGIKDIRKCQVGDTITNSIRQLADQNSKFEPLPGYKQPKPMVFFGLYPKSTDDLVKLKEGLQRVVLTDAAISFSKDYSSFLGSGFRVGFLGLLHAEIVKERLSLESGITPLLTQPQVLYQKTPDGSFLEPYMRLLVYIPVEYVGAIMTVCQKQKGMLENISYHDTYAVLTYQMPYSTFIRGLSSKIKSISSGFASIDYEVSGYKPADLVRVEVHVNGVPIDVLSEYCYRQDAIHNAKELAVKLKETLPKAQVRQIIQGVIDGAVVAREEIAPFRKDVLAKMSGGDRSRKDKLLKKQKKGKAKMKGVAKIDLSQEALFSFFT